MKTRLKFVLAAATVMGATLVPLASPSAIAQTQATATLPMMPATVPPGQVDPSGTLRFAWVIVPATLDPHGVRENSQVGIFYESLFVIDAKRRVYQGLATGYTVSPDRDSITITLRRGAEFADGSPVDAAAVKASLDRARTLNTSLVRALLGVIESTVVVNPTTIRLNLRQFDATLIYSLGNAAGSVINPKFITEDISKKPAGSTPYRLVSYLPTRRVVAERRAGATSWDPNAFKAKRIEIHAVTDPNAAINGLRSGKFDVARIDLTTQEVRSRTGNQFEYHTLPGESPTVVYLRDRGGLASPAVRRAIGQAIDMKGIAEKVANRCEHATQLGKRGELGYIQSYDPYEFNPTAAKRVLDGRNIRIDAAVGNFSVYPAIAQVMKQNLADVGVDLRITLLSPTEAIGQYFAGTRDALVLGYGAQADLMLTINNEYLGAARAAGNQASLIAAQIAQANKYPLGSKERASAARHVVRTAMEQHTILPICHSSGFYVASKKVKGLSVMTNGWGALLHVRPLVVTR